MRFSSALALAAASTPLLASAKGTLGYALGVRHKDSKCKEYSDYLEDLKVLQSKGNAKIVRTYAGVDGGAEGGDSCTVPEPLLHAASDTGVKVVLGIWLGPNTKAANETYDQDVEATLSAAATYPDNVYAFTIGSEGLYRQEQKNGTGYEVDFVLGKINEFKDKVSNDKKYEKLTAKPVGTADSWNKFQDGTANDLITGQVKLLLVNAFGYWQSQDISNASATYLDDLQQAFGVIQSVAGSTDSIELWNGETGWPTTGGSDYHDDKYQGTAKAGNDNAQTFFSEGVCAALDWNVNVFYFEAFNEPWKPKSTGLNGRQGDEAHWGAFDADRVPIITDFSCKYTATS